MCGKRICLISLALVLGILSAASANLVGHWRFDEDSGAVAADSSGNGYDGALLGDPQWIVGYLDGALEFDGNGDYVDLPISPLLGSLTNSTFATWVDFSNEGGAWQRIFDFGINETFNMFLTPRTDTGGPMRFAITITSWNDEDQTTAPATCPSGWHHVAVTLNAQASTHTLYLDGEAIAENTSARYTPSDLGETTQNWLGRSQYGADAYFDGRLDDFRIYNRVLAPGHVEALFNGTPPDFAKAYDPVPKDGAMHSDTWANIAWKAGDFAVSHDVYFGDSFDAVNDGTRDSEVFRGNQASVYFVVGFPGFPLPEGLVPGATYYWRVDEVDDANPDSPWKGPVWSFSIPPKEAYNPVPADGAESVPLDVQLEWTLGLGARVHTVSFGDDFDTVANVMAGVPAGAGIYDPGPLEAAKIYYWRVDTFDGVATYQGDVWCFSTPGAVGNAQPVNNATGVAMTGTVLSWTPADSAASHEIYFGLDKEAVRTADSSSPEYKGSSALGSESYDPGKLAWHTLYHWRVDAVDSLGNTTKGPICSFTTANFIAVDDFESYTDDDAAGEAIWQSWIDGFGVPENGAQAGYLVPPYAEQTVVHGGGQSMPLVYDNAPGAAAYSQAELTLSYPRDWTEESVGELSLWFYGNPQNAAEPLYLTVSNSTGAPVTRIHENPDVALKSVWRQWVIPLPTLADQGIDLTNVDKIAIGLGTRGVMTTEGGTGTMFIDDIALSRSEP